MSLATRYRPTSLEEVIGNSAVKKVIQSMLTKKDFTHVLLEGVTGSGKTTLAYIIAREFGAIPEAIDDVNCVHFSSINDMRAKIEELSRPSFIGHRVLILDEIHRLSSHSQDVLLKPLEGGLDPEVLLIACTTTTDKMSPMLLDRFKRLKVKTLDDYEALLLISSIEEKENIPLPKWKKALLVEKSDGIPRRILSGMEKIANIDEKNEVTFLLDLASFDEESSDVLELFKVILAMQSWDAIKAKLALALKTTTPEGLRVALANIIGARLMSAYGSLDEKTRLSNIFEEYLRQPLTYPEKSAIINVVYGMSHMSKLH